MAVPTTKATLKSYCLRSLGYGVIDINISDDQTDDRLDEALQYFAQYHYDGIGTPLQEFISFQIKIIMQGTNTSTPPRLKDLRILALAT